MTLLAWLRKTDLTSIEHNLDDLRYLNISKHDEMQVESNHYWIGTTSNSSLLRRPFSEKNLQRIENHVTHTIEIDGFGINDWLIRVYKLP